MGKYQKGILGSFQGKVGTVVGSTWKGMEIMKSKNKKSTKPPTQKQLVQRVKFAFLENFLSPIAELLKLTFKDTAINMTEINSAFKYNFKNAITGVYPAFLLDYTKVLVSKGQLLNAINPTATAAGGGIVKVTWTDNSGIAMANATDKCIIVVYCADLKQFVHNDGGAARNAGADSINAGNFTGKTVETWVAFITADHKEVATSIFTGQLIVT